MEPQLCRQCTSLGVLLRDLFLHNKFCIKEGGCLNRGLLLKTPNTLVHHRLLLSLDRRNGVEEARDTLALAEQYMKFPGDHQVKVVGVDLSGDPTVSLYLLLVAYLWYILDTSLCDICCAGPKFVFDHHWNIQMR